MKPLPKTYFKNGYQFNQVDRTGDVAIYSQSLDSKIIAYEVFKVQKLKERHINGGKIEAREACPSNEQWGTRGWTYWNLDDAMAKAAILQPESKKNPAFNRG
jgi:hypothetical protein